MFPPLPVETAAALGQIAVSWSNVEDYCGLIVTLLADLEPIQHAILSEISFQQRLSIINSLILETREPDLFDHWSDMLTCIDKLRVARNDLIHGLWRAMGDKHQVMRITARRRVSVKFTVADADYMAELESKIVEMLDQLSWFTTELGKRGFKKVFSDAQTKPHLDPTQGHKARVLAQAREAKQTQKQADRQRGKNERATHCS